MGRGSRKTRGPRSKHFTKQLRTDHLHRDRGPWFGQMGLGSYKRLGLLYPRKVGHFYQMLHLGYEWIRSWFGSKTYPIKRKPCCFRLVVDASTAWPPRQRWCIAHKPRSNWTIQQSIISLNSRVYLSQSHLFHMFFNLENTQPAIAFAQHSPLWHPDVSPLSEVGWIACLHTVVQRRFAQASTWYANPASTDSQAPILHFTKVLTTFETTFGGWFWYILDESSYGHYLKGVILYLPLNLKFPQGGQPSNCQAEAQLGAQCHVWNLYRRAGLNNMHWNPCESLIAVIQNYNDRILIASVLVDRFNENRNKESSLHNHLWTVLSTSCCNSRSWPIWTTTPRPGSKAIRYLQNMIWEVPSLSAALETFFIQDCGCTVECEPGFERVGGGLGRESLVQVTFRWLPGQRSLGMKHFRSRIISRFSPSSMPSLSLSLSQCLVNDKAIFLNNTGLSKFYIWKLLSALKNHQASLARQISRQSSISPPKDKKNI